MEDFSQGEVWQGSNTDLPKNKFNFFSKKKILVVIGVLVFIFGIHFLFLSVPSDFPLGTIVSIDKGMGLRSISLQLKNEHIIKSRAVFETFLIAYGGERHLVSTDYLMDARLPVYEIARRMSKGESHLAPLRVVIPEGFDNEQIAETFSAQLSLFDKNKFLSTAKQGYLFPDTYFFLTRATTEDVVKLMSDTFNRKILPIQSEISAQGKSQKDIINMASLIERESNGDDRNIISGILWKRISLGMPLQVDAAPETYKTKGLPKVPICNPGLEAIKAALKPTASPYLYYLHDTDGNTHYAKTFEEHKANKLKYLK
ncbi:endolytic transglycosylase MltG [Patescibacteria group bacterium]|nr:endolytic transglycosylase MltG [Patescibacteria group bacterium]